jgi:uncharacterized protein
MPRKDGTGPAGQGPGTGGSKSGCTGAGRGMGRRGGFAAGPGGNCVCAKCGVKVAHKVGIVCSSQKCPECGTTMTRE